MAGLKRSFVAWEVALNEPDISDRSQKIVLDGWFVSMTEGASRRVQFTDVNHNPATPLIGNLSSPVRDVNNKYLRSV